MFCVLRKRIKGCSRHIRRLNDLVRFCLWCCLLSGKTRQEHYLQLTWEECSSISGFQPIYPTFLHTFTEIPLISFYERIFTLARQNLVYSEFQSLLTCGSKVEICTLAFRKRIRLYLCMADAFTQR